MMLKYLLPGLAVVTLGAAETFFPVEDPQPGNWFVNSVRHSRPTAEKFYREKLDKLDPRPVRAQWAELYHQMIEQRFVSNRFEEEAIEKALGWPRGDFTWHNHKFYTRTGCTSWIIAPDASSTGACIVQKNRDYTGQNLLSVRLFRAAPGRYKVLTVTDLWNTGAGAAMNEKGVMIVQNDASNKDSMYRSVTTGCIFILRYIAENCATKDEAVSCLKEFYRSGIARSGSIYLIADLNSGAIVEATARRVAGADLDFAFEARANTLLLPGMRNSVINKREYFLKGANRRFAASEFLRKTLQEKGRIAPVDLMRLARLRDPEDEKAGFRQVCMKNTLASTMMVPDRMFPDFLSVAFVALGPTRHTVFVPIPMGVSRMPESLVDGEWGTAALELAKKLPLDHNRLPEFEALEKKFINEFFTAREEARKLLLNRKKNDAVKLLDDLFARQYEEAKAFIAKVTAETPAPRAEEAKPRENKTK